MLSASIVIGKYHICSLVPKIRCTYLNSQALIIFYVKNGPEKCEETTVQNIVPHTGMVHFNLIFELIWIDLLPFGTG
jgi:hypothetical protein